MFDLRQACASIHPYSPVENVYSVCMAVYFSSAAMLLNPSPVNTWFERISIMVILLNCVTLGMYQPCENIDCTSDRCQILQVRWTSVCLCLSLCVRTTCQRTNEEKTKRSIIWHKLRAAQHSSCHFPSSCDADKHCSWNISLLDAFIFSSALWKGNWDLNLF